MPTIHIEQRLMEVDQISSKVRASNAGGIPGPQSTTCNPKNDRLRRTPRKMLLHLA